MNIVFVTPILFPTLLCACNTPDARPATIADIGQQEYAQLARQSLEGLDSLRFEVKVVDQRNMKMLNKPREKGTTHTKFSVFMADGGRYRAEMRRNGSLVAESVCDGKEVFEWVASDRYTDSDNAWTRYFVPETRRLPLLFYGSARMLLDFVMESWTDTDTHHGRQLQEMLESADTVYKTTKIDDGQEVDVFVNRESQFAWQIMQHAKGKTTLYLDHTTHLLRKVNESQKWTGVTKSGWSKTQTRYHNVQLNPPVPDNVFKFKPPAGSKYVPLDDHRFDSVRPQDILVGKIAPDFTLASLTGEEVSLSDTRSKNKAIILAFWATWCPPCRQEIPALRRLHQEFSKAGLAILAVTSEKDLSSLKKFAKQQSLPYTVLPNPQHNVALSYRVKNIPRTFLINKSGVILKVWAGWRGKEEEAEIRTELAKLLR